MADILSDVCAEHAHGCRPADRSKPLCNGWQKEFAHLRARRTLPRLVSVPPLFSMALGVPPAMVTLASARALPLFTANTPLMLPPLMVITPPPSMVVLAPLNPFVLVTVIVAAPPQLKVTLPLKLAPPGRQASSATSVQLALVPVPTTHAKADEVAPSTPKTSSARTNTSGVRTVAVLIACLPC